MPQEALKGVIDTFNALDFLKTMEANLDKTGLIMGRIHKAGAALGFGEGAIEFENSRKQFKLAAQSMIKGIPSNFDVQIMIDTLADLSDPEPVARNKIEISKRMVNSLIRNTLSYYKAAGFTVPDNLVAEATRRGIDINKVPDWNPASNSMERGPDSGVNVDARGAELTKWGLDEEQIIQVLIKEGYIKPKQ
jgi:hypothetical protein